MTASRIQSDSRTDRLFRSLRGTVDSVDLAIEGDLPDWLDGVLLRNGPADFEPGGQPVEHWFDGLAMLHAIRLSAGQARYTRRPLQSRARAAADAGRVRQRGFATDPCWGLFGRLRTAFSRATDNANVAIARLGDDIVAMGESALPIAFDPDSLETRGPVPIGGLHSLSQRHTSAHPIPLDGGYLTHVLRFGRRSTFEIRFTRDGKSSCLARVPSPRPAYVHSFAITPTRIVLTEFPFTIAPLGMLTARAPFVDNLEWHPERGTLFHVIDRDDGAVRTVVGPSAFGFHHVRARDDGPDVILEFVGYDDPSVIDRLRLDPIRRDATRLPRGTLRRIRITPREAVEASRSDVALEMPTLGTRRPDGSGFVYAAEARCIESSFLDGIVKLDPDTNTTLRWSERDVYPGEPIFVARPRAVRDDDGIVVSVCTDTTHDRSFVVILDGGTLTERARLPLPDAIPAGLHGAYLSNACNATGASI